MRPTRDKVGEISDCSEHKFYVKFIRFRVVALYLWPGATPRRGVPLFSAERRVAAEKAPPLRLASCVIHWSVCTHSTRNQKPKQGKRAVCSSFPFFPPSSFNKAPSLMCLRSLTLALDFAYAPASDLGPDTGREFRQGGRASESCTQILAAPGWNFTNDNNPRFSS